MTDELTYFELDPEAGGAGRFLDLASDVPSIEYLPGLSFRPVLGQNVMVNFVSFEPHTEAPLHSHAEEQITFVVEGEFEFEVGGEKRILRPGQAAVVPPNVPHAARTFDSMCLEVDVFHPPRQALLELVRRQTSGE